MRQLHPMSLMFFSQLKVVITFVVAVELDSRKQVKFSRFSVAHCWLADKFCSLSMQVGSPSLKSEICEDSVKSSVKTRQFWQFLIEKRLISDLECMDWQKNLKEADYHLHNNCGHESDQYSACELHRCFIVLIMVILYIWEFQHWLVIESIQSTCIICYRNRWFVPVGWLRFGTLKLNVLAIRNAYLSDTTTLTLKTLLSSNLKFDRFILDT